MSTYAIGDIQGCFRELEALLKKIKFNPQHDQLWFAGDLVNRGKNSVDVLRFIKSLGSQHKTVLGNHDLHLLGVAYGQQKLRHNDTFQDILNAEDREELLTWLRQQHLFHHDKQLNYCIIHAGIPPQWNIESTKIYAQEVENILQGTQYQELLTHMYGNEPHEWNPYSESWERYRFILNALTRMRYVDSKGRLNFSEKGPVGTQAAHLVPWFNCLHPDNHYINIIFGHWASLVGVSNVPHVFAIDTGCSWGYQLTALRLEDKKRFSVDKLK